MVDEGDGEVPMRLCEPQERFDDNGDGSFRARGAGWEERRGKMAMESQS